jgi:putative transposase
MTLIHFCYCWLLTWLRIYYAGRWFKSKAMRRRRGKRAPCAPVKRFHPAPLRRSGGKPKPSWVVEVVLRLHTEGGKSYRDIMHEFNRLYAHQGMTVCLNTVYAWVQKHCTEAEAVRRATHNRFPAHAPANLRWCLDGTGKMDGAGAVHFILGIVDHGTRLNLVLTRLAQASAAAILEQVLRAVERFGKPRLIRTDNASVFHSAAFQEGLAAAGIRHEFTEPGKPWQNGRIERFFLTLKQKLNQIVPLNGAALDSLLAEFSDWYNAVRPHQHLHGFTPTEVWIGVDPYKKAPKAVRRFEGWEGMLRGYYLRR